MLILAFVDVKTYLKKEHKDLKSAILSLGIQGTFLWIFIGLMGFDTTNIQQSVPNMLDGLKIAFFTSIAGMTIAVSLFVFQKFKPIESPQDASIEYINKQLQKLDRLEKLENLDYLEMLKALYHQKEIDKNTKEMSEEIKKLSIHLKSSHQQTYDLLLSSFEHVIGTLKSAIEEISKGASKEIIDALGAVIKDFNNNLNEQFGDNFKELNTGVQNLLEWQHNYKSSVEESEKALKSAASSLASSKETFELIASKNSDIMDVYRELSLIINTYSNQTKTLNAQLEQYARLGEKSQEMLTSIDELFKNSQEKYGLLGENFENYIITSKEKIEGLLKEFVEKSYEQNTFLIEQIKTESESSQEQLRNLMQSTTMFFKEELEIFNDSSKEISETLQESSKSALLEHSQVLQDINKESVDLYKKHSDKLNELMDHAKEGTESFRLSLERVHEESKALMHEYQSEIMQNQERFIESLKEDAKESFKAIEEQNSSSIKEYIDRTSELTRGSVESIKDSLQGSLTGFKDTQGEMLEHFKETQASMKSGHDEVRDEIKQTNTTLVESITNSQKNLNENIINSNGALKESIHNLFSSIASETKESVEFLKAELFGSIEQSVKSAITSSEEFLNSFIDDLSKNSKESQEIIFTILDSVKTSVDSSKEAVDSLSSSAKTSIEQSFESASNAHKLLSQQGSKTLSQLDLLTKKLMIEQKNMLKNSLEEYGGFVEESKKSLRSLFTTIDEFNTEFTLKNSETLNELSESTKGSIESISREFKEHSSKTLDEIKELLDKSSAEYMKTLENNVNEGKDIPIKIAQNIKAAFMQAQKEISAYSKSTNSSILSSKEMAEKLNSDIRNSIKEQVDENRKLNEEMQKGLRILDNSLQNVIMNFKNDYEWFLRRVRELMGADRL
eukprot:TRINITY_DN12137_c0_g1_i1.p1 TRINITY_DN12137_c0_g1~~TRINITY_DN12137_c0_g1_i1.p1  ORF type:complete len:903 (+),score=119.30 TRINITY_DN12137_c0_g1_i1:3650-6358(+)